MTCEELLKALNEYVDDYNTNRKASDDEHGEAEHAEAEQHAAADHEDAGDTHDDHGKKPAEAQGAKDAGHAPATPAKAAAAH